MAGISQSVGRGGRNVQADVTLVQQLLKDFVSKQGLSALEAGGICGPATERAISEYQRRVLKQEAPDGCIDPNGRTWRALTGDTIAGPASSSAADTVKLSYAADLTPDKQIVSAYAKTVIRRALAMAGMKAGVMTSTLRTPRRQAELMYQNAALDLAKQYGLYADTGRLVLDVFRDNKGKPKEEVITLMAARIESLLGQDRFVSRHVTTPARYAQRNVVDLGVNTNMPFLAGGKVALLTNAFTKLAADEYIATFIDETKKSNNCWHVEIVPDAKPL